MKKIYYLILGIFIVLITYFLFKGFDVEIEEEFKKNFFYSLFLPVVAVFIKLNFSFFKDSKWILFFSICFVFGFSSGIGIVAKSLIDINRLSYVGLTFIIYSLPLLIFSLSFGKKR